ncbi:hypothetical protein LRP67_20010 [Nocardioides sp. cx-169]|uniref:hypothetical protein n=1 Tax=Nocardioides sp. cx-169 TaxID=2899080 RepID=UPI001E309E09|nr:hypothetical protein [Nocardioides sp. cx-169]MCD4536384.1 hypothetical protein [Nocardioides sp. cx-169]
MPWAPHRPVEKHRFLLELWAEPREVASRLLRLRGRIRHLPSPPPDPPPDQLPDQLPDGDCRGVAGLADVDALVRDTFAEDGLRVEWEAEP